MNAGAPSPRRLGWIPGLLVAAGLPLAVGLARHTQGIDLLHDGLWLLGAQELVSGRFPWTHLEIARSPGDLLLLSPLFAVFGSAAHTLALLRALLDGAAAALGWGWARRNGAGLAAWLVPLAVLALGPVPGALLFTGVTAALMPSAPGASRARLLAAGLSAAALSCFGLGWALLALTLPTLVPWAAGASLRRRPPAALLLPPLVLWVAVGLLAAAAGGFDRLLDALLVGPWHALLGGGVAGAWHGFRGGPWLTLPFAELRTGETLEAAWPAHALLRASALRALYLLALGLPALALLRRVRRGAAPQLATAFATALAGLFLLWSDGGVLSLRTASLGILLLLPPLAASARRHGWIPTALVALLLLPLAAEPVWLSVHGAREGLVLWERPRAGVRVAERRARRLDHLFAGLGARAQQPTLIWPAQPGLHFLMDCPPAHPRLVLPGGRIEDAERLAVELEQSPPRVILLGLTPRWSTLEIRRQAPRLWEYWRGAYRILGTSPPGPDAFRVLGRMEGGAQELATLSLPERLPDVELSIANDVSPALRPHLTVGQSFPVGARDLSGISVRWQLRGEPVTVPVRIRVWMRRGDEFDALLDLFDLEMEIPRDRYRSFVRLGPVPDTAGRELLVTLELREDSASELRLLWHRHDAGPDTVDLFEEGGAMLDRHAVAADLYFSAW